MLDRAISIAACAHEGQFDKGGQPYILHCLAVMMKVPEQYRVAAVLHDTLEDTAVTEEFLRQERFLEDDIHIVKLLTKQEGQSYEQYLAGVMTHKGAMIVKMADLEHNSDIRRLKGVTEKDFQRMRKYHSAYLMLKKELERW